MQPYVIDLLPLGSIDYQPLVTLIGDANAKLAFYNGLLSSIPNPQVMLSPLTNQEATLSSKIEGTQATAREVMEHDAGLIKDGEKGKDIQEIRNYRQALQQANQHLAGGYPILLGFIQELHKILMNSVRGESKTPGYFRKKQNWIGNIGCSMEEATFVPPSPLTLNNDLANWCDYIQYNEKDALVQTAIVHAQFELIHPFEDGNGRIGRILIPLFLYDKEKLSTPMFYLSEYLERNRDAYYAGLLAISQKNDWQGWITFFLEAIIHQARSNAEKVQKIINLYGDMKLKIQEITHSQYTIYLLDYLFKNPIFKSSQLVNSFQTERNINRSTTLGLIQKLKKEDVLFEMQSGAGRKSATLGFLGLLSITEDLE